MVVCIIRDQIGCRTSRQTYRLWDGGVPIDPLDLWCMLDLCFGARGKGFDRQMHRERVVRGTRGIEYVTVGVHSLWTVFQVSIGGIDGMAIEAEILWRRDAF